MWNTIQMYLIEYNAYVHVKLNNCVKVKNKF